MRRRLRRGGGRFWHRSGRWWFRTYQVISRMFYGGVTATYHPYCEQHSFAVHFAFRFWGPQFPARAPDTSDKTAKVVKVAKCILINSESILEAIDEVKRSE
jgi:hypothetical protein